MAREAAEINQAGPALLFAFGCLAWAARAGLTHAVQNALRSDGASHGDSAMAVQEVWRGRSLAFVGGIAATALGLIYLSSAGAPTRMMMVNLAALAAGLIVALPLMRREAAERLFAGTLAVLAGAALLSTAILGDDASGARRWLSVGGIALQPSLILMPLLVLAFARSRDILTAFGIILAAIALAVQPDRAMAGALAAGLTVIVLFTRDRMALLCLIAVSVGFAITWLRPDVVPPTPFVDRVFLTAFSAGVVPGLAVWIGAILSIAPAALGVIFDPRHRAIHAAFAATWAAIILAAIVADYPTPLVAYSGSSIVGYILASAGLPRRWSRSHKRAGKLSVRMDVSQASDANLVLATS